jgi:nucleotide-binding universal stress UspA family protein
MNGSVRILLGVDGSAGSEAALRCALWEARLWAAASHGGRPAPTVTALQAASDVAVVRPEMVPVPELAPVGPTTDVGYGWSSHNDGPRHPRGRAIARFCGAPAYTTRFHGPSR